MNALQKAGLTFAFLCSLAAIGCGQGIAAKDQPKEGVEEEGIRVETAPVRRGVIEATIKSSCHLEAEEEVKVHARTSNRVTELLVEEGDEVQKGQLLLRLNDDVQATAFRKAEVKFEKAKQEFDRQQVLFQQKLISQQAFNEAQFELKQLDLALEDARRELEYTAIRAPIKGTITKRLVKYGDLVNVNQHLFDLVDFSSIIARIYIPEKHLTELALNQPARVIPHATRSQSIDGFLKRIAPVVEAKSGTIKVTIGFGRPKELRPGMYVDVELVTSLRTNALLITKRALVYDGELSYVFRVLPEEKKVERVLVESKTSDKLHIEPVSGFKEGDLIVVAGQTGLRTGSKVRLMNGPGTPGSQEGTTKQAEKPSALEES